MQKNRLRILIKKPIEDVFAFTTDPKNTPIWVEHFAYEETSTWPPVVGTIYKNRTLDGTWSECSVIAIRPLDFFELQSKDGIYHVQYTYTNHGDKTEMEYFEWVDSGVLEGPFAQHILERLRYIMESK